MHYETSVLVTSASMLVGPIIASETTVELLNLKDGENLVLSEKFAKIGMGDAITFMTAKPGHCAEIFSGRFPKAAELHGQIGKRLSYQFNISSIHLVRCAQHSGMGMVPLVGIDSPTEYRSDQAGPSPWEGRGDRV